MIETRLIVGWGLIVFLIVAATAVVLWRRRKRARRGYDRYRRSA